MPALSSTLSKFSASLARPVSNAHQMWSARSGLLLRVTTPEGHVGLGEASPLPNYSPDSLDACQACLESLTLFPADELGVLRIAEFVDHMPKGLPAARFAVETALLDLLAQERNESVAALLGGQSISASRAGLVDPQAPLPSVQALRARGIHTGKLKVGRNWNAELAAIAAIAADHPSFRLRLDVNGAWSLPEAMHRLQALQRFGLEYVEQPVSPGKMHNLVGSPIPLAADESMHTELGREALGELLADAALIAVVLKPTVQGGLLACRDLARWAAENNTECVASHCFEGAVGTAAVAEFAVASKGSLPAGVDRHDALAFLPAATIPQLHGDGLYSHVGGLGVRFS